MDHPVKEGPVTLWSLFGAFLRIGASGFGGMIALLGLLQEQMVERRKWVTAEEFNEGVAIGQILPGPIVVDTATHLGYRLHGWKGAVLSTLGLILPAFLLMLVLSPIYLRYGRLPQMSGVFWGIRAAVMAVIVAACYRLGRSSLRDWRSGLIAVGAFVGLTFFKIDAALLILLCGTGGLFFLRPSASPPGSTLPPAEPSIPAEESGKVQDERE